MHPLDPRALAALTYVAPKRTTTAPFEGALSATAGAEEDTIAPAVDDLDVEEREAADVLHVALGEEREGGESGGMEPMGEPRQA